MTIPSFKRKTGPKFRPEKKRTRERWRGNSSDRGYDGEWSKLSLKYRKAAKGLCEECGRRGIVSTCDVVDHMIPVSAAPDMRLDWRNLDALCHSCHNGWKRLIEKWAIKTQQVRLLPMWVKHPDTRPAHFRIRVGEGDVVGRVAFNRSRMDSSPPASASAVSPGPDPEMVFAGSGIIETMVNGTECDVEIMDGDDVVYILRDGASLQSRVAITNGLSLRAERASSRKVSVTYVCDRA